MSPITTTAMFQSVGIFSGFMLPIAVLVLFIILVIPGLSRAGTNPMSLALAAYGFLAEALGIILMTAGGLPAVYAVVAHQTLASNTYLSLLILFIAGGITYLWHDAMLRKVDPVSKAIPESLFFYAWKFIGLVVTLFAVLSFILDALAGSTMHREGWWIVYIVMLLYGLLLSWFTLKPTPPRVIHRPVPAPKKKIILAAKAKKPTARKR